MKSTLYGRLSFFKFGYCACRKSIQYGFSPRKERIMPKSNKPPKYSKMGKYAVVYVHCKPRYLGLFGSPESKVAYARFLAELQSSPSVPLPSREKHVTISELTAAFLEDAEVNSDPVSYGHCRVVILDFLDRFFGDGFSVDSFKPSCLALVQKEMIQSGRYCRRTVNDHTRRIVSIFAWGVRHDFVQETTWRALKTVKVLQSGAPGTFDKEERQADLFPKPLIGKGKKLVWAESQITEWLNRQSTPVNTTPSSESPAKRLKQESKAFEDRQKNARQILAHHAASRNRQHNSHQKGELSHDN
jgi:predicted DNA-binding transcriptional regulator AlpA